MSIIVMGYRNVDTVLASVGSVVAQATTEVEVIVVTSGGDDTGLVVSQHFPEIRLVDNPEQLFPGGARNLGVARSRGRVVAFLAADCLAEPGWVQGRLARHRDGFSAVAAAMTCAPPRAPSSLASLFLLFPRRLSGRPGGPVDSHDIAAHGLSYDRELLKDLGPFDETIRAGEDTAMAYRLGERGIPIWFEPGVRTAHTGPPRMSSLLHDQYRRAERRTVKRGVQMPDASVAGLVLVAARGFGSTVFGTVRLSRRNGGDDRPQVLAVLPWIVAGAAASQVAWLRVQLSNRRSATSSLVSRR